MSQLTGFADLAGKRVGLFGFGVEGRASARRLEGITDDLVIVDDDSSIEGVRTSAQGGLDALATCDVVLKSPGIPRRRSDVIALEERGVTVTSALNLWLHEIDATRVVAVTGTKGKSTTTSLVTFFLRCLGEVAHELGNFGQPPYDPDIDLTAGWLVLEVSSFQSVDLTSAPGLVLVTSLGSDHLDWHGSLEQYYDDKLSITRASGEHVTMIPDTPEVEHAVALMGGQIHIVPADDTDLAHELGLLGAHNDHNVGLALAASALVTGRSLDEVLAAVRERANDFTPLRGRLTLIASRENGSDTWRFVDDGLATGPLPTIAALEVFADVDVALIAGGFDRGVDYEHLVQELRARGPATTLVSIGPAGERLATMCEGAVTVRRANDMASAVEAADAALAHGGVVLFSPAAPSFDAYRNWSERSDDFARAVRRVIASK